MFGVRFAVAGSLWIKKPEIDSNVSTRIKKLLKFDNAWLTEILLGLITNKQTKRIGNIDAFVYPSVNSVLYVFNNNTIYDYIDGDWTEPIGASK